MHRNRLINNLLICLVCLILNILLAFVARVTHSPFFFDTIFTVSATFIGGLVPGLIVAVLFNPLMTLVFSAFYGMEIAFFDFLYAVCGMAIVFITWIFSRNKIKQHNSYLIIFTYLLLIAFLTALASSFVASILDAVVRPLFMNNLGLSPIDNFSKAFESLQLGSFFSYFLPRLPVTFVDRLICTFAGYAAYRGLEFIQLKRQ